MEGPEQINGPQDFVGDAGRRNEARQARCEVQTGKALYPLSQCAAGEFGSAAAAKYWR